MTKESVIEAIVRCGFIPIIRTHSAAAARRAAQAISAGGATLLEITMTVPGALDVLKELHNSLGEKVMVGAGTVIDSQSARMAMLAGAQFVISPIVDEATIRICRRHGVTVIPGAMTPTEIVKAWQMGADFVKIFPAGCLGGPRYIKALKSPLPHIKLIPTGGVDYKNAPDYISAGAVAVGVGNSLIGRDPVQEINFDEAVQNVKNFLHVIEKARLSRISDESVPPA